MTDSAGRFVIDSLAWGDYLLDVRRIGYEADTIRVRVRPDSTVSMAIRMRALGLRPMQDLPAVRQCRDGAVSRHSAAPLGKEDSLLVAVLCTAFTLADPEHDFASYCVPVGPGAVPEVVVAAFAGRQPVVRPGSQCRRNEAGEVVDVDGEGAVAFAVDLVRTTSGDRAVVEFSHLVAPLWAGGWQCVFRRTSAGWEPEACEMTWIS